MKFYLMCFRASVVGAQEIFPWSSAVGLDAIDFFFNNIFFLALKFHVINFKGWIDVWCKVHLWILCFVYRITRQTITSICFVFLSKS